MHAGPYEAVARELSGTPFASIDYRETTGSTNADAAARLGDGASAGQTIVAEHQRAGAGRKGRSWESEPGSSLLFTTILPQSVATSDLWVVPFWVGLAVAAALRACAIETLLQWPNDVLLGGRKLAGILCQSAVAGRSARVACGVGINVRRPPERFDRWAFCDDATDETERAALLEAVLRAYAADLPALREPQRVATRWMAAAEVPGARYRIALDGAADSFEATALALEPGGALALRRDDGLRQCVEMADARVLR